VVFVPTISIALGGRENACQIAHGNISTLDNMSFTFFNLVTEFCDKLFFVINRVFTPLTSSNLTKNEYQKIISFLNGS
jgi:hypothetical protein